MRVKTGISGLDELMEGGFPTGSSVLVSGRVGTGKSIFAMQYMAKGITDYGDLGVFVSLERGKKDLCDYASAFGWHFQRLEKQGSLQILGGQMSNVVQQMRRTKAKIEDLLSEIVETVKTSGSRRVVFERVDFLSMFFPEERDFKVQLDYLRGRLARLNCTSILTSEIREGLEEFGRGGPEEILDGVIVLYYEGEGESLMRERALEIRKMRGTRHSNRLHFFDITDAGIVVRRVPEKRRPKLRREVRRPIEPAISLRALKEALLGKS
jgi:KaiC/GvpD/RAD55 family RecA-like ATPase